MLYQHAVRVLRRHRLSGLALMAAGAAVALDARRPRTRPARSNGLEIERKYLVEALPADLESRPSEEIEQGYLAVDGPVEVRLRRHGERPPTLTVKAGAGEARIEQQLVIAETSLDALWPLTSGRRLRKRRYVLPAGAAGLSIELDVYGGWLRGLTVAEVEFPTLEASAAFQAPDWLGREITGDPEYRNQCLATRETRARAERVFRLRAEEPVAEGIRRVALGQIDEVLDRAEGRTDQEPGTAVHESRKSLKRVRAVARLVRGELGDVEFERQNEAFRDAGRLLSGSRDSQVLIESLDGLTKRYPLEVRAIQLGAFRTGLARARDTASTDLDGDGGPLHGVESTLLPARESVEGWQLRKPGFDALGPGLERIYRRGRRAYSAAIKEPTAENLHEWRKRTKDLWYSLQLLEIADPARMKPLARTAHRLSELLGDDHDLVVLAQRVDACPQDWADADAAALVRGLCERRRAELQVAAFGVGSRLYRDPAASFVERIERRWRKEVDQP